MALRAWIAAIWRHWRAFVTGSVALWLVGGLAFSVDDRAGFFMWLVVSVVGGLQAAAFKAWEEEYRKRLTAEISAALQRPKLALGFDRSDPMCFQENAASTWVRIAIHNGGAGKATGVRLAVKDYVPTSLIGLRGVRFATVHEEKSEFDVAPGRSEYADIVAAYSSHAVLLAAVPDSRTHLPNVLEISFQLEADTPTDAEIRLRMEFDPHKRPAVTVVP